MTRDKIFLVGVFIAVVFLLLNTTNSQGSGDDFAMYLQQSKSFFKGEDWHNNYFIFNPSDLIYSPKAYTMGFPVILTPVWFFEGQEILFAKYIQLIGLALLLCCLFYYGRKRLESDVLMIVYPFLVGGLLYANGAVENITADLWMIAIGVIIIMSIGEKNDNSWRREIGIGICLFLVYWIKPVGLVYLATVLATVIWENRQADKQKTLIKIMRYVGPFICLYLLLGAIGWMDWNGEKHFISIASSHDIWQLGIDNLLTYKNEILAMIGALAHGSFYYFTKPLSYLFLILFLIGLVFVWKDESKESGWFVVMMLPVLWLFPNAQQGLRYFWPLLPMYILLVLKAASWILKNRIVFMFPVLLVLIVLMVLDVQQQKNKKTFNVAANDTVLMYKQIENKIPEEGRILCAKPRLMGYMTGRNAGRVSKNETINQVWSFVREEKIEWVFISDYMPNPAIEAFVLSDSMQWKAALKFEHASLYHLTSESDHK